MGVDNGGSVDQKPYALLFTFSDRVDRRGRISFAYGMAIPQIAYTNSIQSYPDLCASPDVAERCKPFTEGLATMRPTRTRYFGL
jgi:hypothetical protein